MSTEDKGRVIKENGKAEKRPPSPGATDRKAPTDGGKSPAAPSEQKSQDPSGISQSQESASPAKEPAGKVELDLEGLAKGKKEPSRAQGVPSPPVASKKRRWNPALAVPVFIALLLGAAWLSYESIKNRKGEEERAGVPAQVEQGRQIPRHVSTIDTLHLHGLTPFFVPIQAQGIGRERFLKLTLSLAFRGEVPSDEIDRRLLMIRSEITDLLLGKSFSDLRSRPGKMALKWEIKDLLNASLSQGSVENIYFEEFYVL